MLRRRFSIVTVVVLGGCSAFGNDTFHCPANVDGATCMSAREVYGATHVADRVSPNYKDGKPIGPHAAVTQSQASGRGLADYQTAAQASSDSPTPAVVDKYRPPLPEVDVPLPVRVPAKVMRIRIFPWEDNARDLNAGSVVFTEVEGRTWTLGEEQTSRVQANVIDPLSVPKASTGTTYQTPLLAPPTARRDSKAPPAQLPATNHPAK